MKLNAFVLAATVSASLVLAGCGGGSTTSAVAPVVSPTAASAADPILKSTGTMKSELSMHDIAVTTTDRSPKGTYGGTPAFDADVSLYDAPIAGFSQVNLEIDEVDAISASGVATPIQTFSSPMVTNILSLQQVAQIFSGSLPGAMYVGVRILGRQSLSYAVTNSGKRMPIRITTALSDQYSIKVAVPFGSLTGSRASVALDLNLAESMLFNLFNDLWGSPNLDLTPLAVATNMSASSMTGVMKNHGNGPVSNAVLIVYDGNWNVVNTTITAADGTFNVHALPGGTYHTVIANAYQNAAGTLIQATGNDGGPWSAYWGPTVTVSPGTTVNLGQVAD